MFTLADQISFGPLSTVSNTGLSGPGDVREQLSKFFLPLTA